MFRLAIAATCVSALMLFIYSNTVLALTTDHYCVVLFELPFTDRSFQLPNWMWGAIPNFSLGDFIGECPRSMDGFGNQARA